MLGDKIKLYRENKKMTQNDLANILEVSSGTISKYESGALEPNIESLKKLSLNKTITLEVSSKNEAAIALYKKSDFKEVGIRKNYYEDSDAIIMKWGI